MSVMYNGQEYSGVIKDGALKLDLSGIGIKSIPEIRGLEFLTDLQTLNLNHNLISDIQGLEHLTNLRNLDLSHNEISEIQGLKTLIQLRKLNLEGNRFITIKGFENLINLKKLNLGLSNWDVKNVKPMERPKHTLILNGKELTGIEKSVVKGGAKHIVAYCRIRLKQAGYAGGLISADSKIESLENKIEKELKKNEKKIRKAMTKNQRYAKRLF